MEKVEKRALVEYGVAAMTLPGEAETGDRYVVVESPSGILTAVIDGLGHGAEAATAAKIAARVLEENSEESLLSLTRRCHESLRGSRGVVLSMAFFSVSEKTMTWLGVGNVGGVFLHRDGRGTLNREELALRGGVLGDQLPPTLSGTILSVSAGDTIILATDGIRPDFMQQDISARLSEQETADYILERYARRTDDALVLVTRYFGLPEERNHV